MACQRRFRILTPDGHLSRDRFFVSAEQPCVVKPGCLLVVHERSGLALTVAETQLFPAEAIHLAPLSSNATSACLARGMLEEGATDQAPRRFVGQAASSGAQLSGAGA